MSPVQDLVKLQDQLKKAVAKKDLVTAKDVLSRLKGILIQLPALPPSFQESPTAQQELSIAREIFEQAVFLSVLQNDEAAFERNYLQLQTYYTDTRSMIPPSHNESLILALNLLRLLVQNRIAEFHTDLELIPGEAQDSDYIKHVVQLEQWLMEGAYNKVLDTRRTVPDPSYTYFMEKLLSTVRDEIAGCSARAYTTLSLADAKKLMMFTSDEELMIYADEQEWQVRDNKVFFQPHVEEALVPLEAVELIGNTLTYARELERIV